MYFEIKPPGKLSLGLHELWQFRELFYYFTWRDIKVKYKQATLGFLWAILQPFILMVVFSMFFGGALEIPTENETPYPLFVFSGLLLWNVFSSGLSNASGSMVTNANMIKKIYFPRLIIPLSSILVALFDFLMALIIYIGMLLWYQHPVSPKIALYLPLALTITVCTTFGLGVFLAALNVKYRDVRYIIPFLIQVLLFITPVIYPVSIIQQEWIKKLLSLNPMAGAIDLLRSCLTNSPVDWSQIGLSISFAFLLFLGGLYYFRKTEYYFADLA